MANTKKALTEAGSAAETTAEGVRIVNRGAVSPDPADWVKDAADQMEKFVTEHILPRPAVKKD